MSESVQDDEDGTEVEQPRQNGGGKISADDIEDLRRQLAQEKAGKVAAAQRAQRAESERDEARGAHRTEAGRRWQAEEEALDTSLSSLTSRQDALEDRYATLIEAGQFKDAAKVQREMADAAAESRMVQQKKQWLDDARKIEEANQQRQPAREMEGEVDLSGYSAKQKRWIRQEHPEYLTDQKFRGKVTAAHYDAIAEGYAVDSEEYFDHIEQMVAKKATPVRQEGEEDEEVEQPAPKRRAVPEVPVLRRTGQSQARQENVRLTPDEREAADFTMPNVPVDDWTDKDGQVQMGRYRRYKHYQVQLRERERLN